MEKTKHISTFAPLVLGVAVVTNASAHSWTTETEKEMAAKEAPISPRHISGKPLEVESFKLPETAPPTPKNQTSNPPPKNSTKQQK